MRIDPQIHACILHSERLFFCHVSHIYGFDDGVTHKKEPDNFLMMGKRWSVPPFVPKIQSSMVLEERNLRNFLATLGCVLVSATAFAMVHWPDIWLMAGTGMMGVPWAVEYLLHRNVFAIGFATWQFPRVG